MLVVDPGLSRCVWVASVCDCSDYWLLTQLSLVAFVASLVHWAVVVSPTTTLLKTAWTPTRIELTEQGNAPDNLEQVSTQTIQTLVHNFLDKMAFLCNLQSWLSKLAPFLLYIVKMGKYTCHWPSKYLSWPLNPCLIGWLDICGNFQHYSLLELDLNFRFGILLILSLVKIPSRISLVYLKS